MKSSARVLFLAASVALVSIGGALAWAAGQSRGPERAGDQRRQFESLDEIQQYYNEQMFQAVQQYLSGPREPADADSAYQWLIQTSLSQGWYERGGRIAQHYLRLHGDDGPPNLVLGAEVLLGVALARQGDLDSAVAVFEEQVARGQPQTEQLAASFAGLLSVEAALGGRPELPLRLHRMVIDSFPLSRYAQQLVPEKMKRFELLGQTAPAIATNDLDGKPVDLADYRGKVVLVDFWATWCRPCLEEMPNLQVAYEKYRDQGFEIIGISIDDSSETVRTFLQQQTLPWRTVASVDAQEEPVDERYNVAGIIPATYLIDASGNVAVVDARGKRLADAVEHLLAQRP